ncbi:acyl carrier protein [Aerococcus christensenii]|nr:acyl carrier protein [Aerococcus christensenii]AMB91861.1 acyl carrier protein [Aerococcus christensenii]MDK8234639.1 acyl carrier protein [Aerococcus christensenii]PKY91002.1 acyl carrier protein [Aerococcus christensenii]
MTTFEIIQGLICDQLDLKKEEVQPTTRLQEELDADSLDIFQIINDIEDEFEISIDEEDMDLETVQDLVDYVEKKK